MRHYESSWLRDTPVAHRGLHTDDERIPENSLAAFRAAIEEEYPIELDVHLLADGNLAVFHDDDLRRMCGSRTLLQNLTAARLSSFRLLGSDERIPLLKEVLELVAGRVPLLIELKGQHSGRALQKRLFELIDVYDGEVAVQSFNPFHLRWFVRNAPAIPRGQLSYSYSDDNKKNFLEKYLLKRLLLNWISKPHFIAYSIDDMPDKRVARLRKNGMTVLCWTVKQDTSFKPLLRFFDNMIFEGFRPR